MNYNNISAAIRNEISLASSEYEKEKEKTTPDTLEDTEDILNKIALEIQRKGG